MVAELQQGTPHEHLKRETQALHTRLDSLAPVRRLMQPGLGIGDYADTTAIAGACAGASWAFTTLIDQFEAGLPQPVQAILSTRGE